jgi:hypothetical protein
MRWILPAAALSAHPRLGYDTFANAYEAFCLQHGLERFEPLTARLFLEYKRRESTVWAVRTASQNMRRYFLDADYDDPFASAAANSYMRQLIDKAHPSPRKQPYSSRLYHQTIDSLPSNDIGIRDAAMIALIYCGRVKGTDLEFLDPEHVTFLESGLRAELIASPKRAPLTLARFADPR